MAERSAMQVAIIRGDIAAIGVVGFVSGLVLTSVFVSGAGNVPGVLALILVPGGLAIIGWARARYRELLAEVIAAHRGHDPGPSPVAWVSDGVWRDHNGFNAERDAADELQASIGDLRSFREPVGRAFEAPTLRVVSDAERAATTPGLATELAPVGLDGDPIEALRRTPGRLIAVGIRWPLCCGRLAVLVATRAGEGPAGSGWLPAEGERPADAGDPSGARGAHAFTCPACHRSWRTEPAW